MKRKKPVVVVAAMTDSVELTNALCCRCDAPLHFSPSKWLHCPKCPEIRRAERNVNSLIRKVGRIEKAMKRREGQVLA